MVITIFKFLKNISLQPRSFKIHDRVGWDFNKSQIFISNKPTLLSW
jgi:hypothetical protein